MRDDPYRPPSVGEPPEASGRALLTVIGLFEVLSGVLGLLILLSGVGEQLKLTSHAWTTGHGWIAVVNFIIFVAFAALFSLSVAAGFALVNRRPGRLARLVPVLLALQSPVLIVPELQFFAALVPPQIGFQILGDGNIRFGVHFAFTFAFKLSLEDTPVPGAVMLNVVPAVLLGWAARRRDSVLFSPRLLS